MLQKEAMARYGVRPNVEDRSLERH